MGQSSSSPPSHSSSGDLASSFDKFFKEFKLETKILSQETIRNIQSYLEKGDLQSAFSEINAALRDIENAPLNIAVTGESGTGKSTFINALRGVGQEEVGAAPTGPVETTMERTPYKHPTFPSVTLWDLPGIGTTTFQPQEYLEEMKFGEYDFFIIISATRFKINDAQLATAIGKMKKKFYFVRTKVDSDLLNLEKSKPTTFNKDEILQRIRDDCVKHLQKANVSDPQVFLVSSLELSGYDFQNLETTLLRELPAHKRHIFMQYLPNITEAAIDRKRDSLKQKVWLEALKAGASATIPLVGFVSDNDVQTLKDALTLYRFHFGLDDSSLKNMAVDLHVSVEKLKTNLISPHLLSIEKDNESLGDKLLRYLEKFCGISGGPIASGLYFRKIFYLQSYFLETVVSDAKRLLTIEEVFKDSKVPSTAPAMSQPYSSTSFNKKDGDLASSFDKFFKEFKLESKILSQETIKLIQSHLKEGDLQRAVSAINDALRDIDNAPLSIAVTGEAGTGKSTFINALRGLGHEDELAASTGELETTLERTPYSHPKFPNVTLWDLPGMGTTTFQPRKYLEEMKFGEYDFFIIISATRFKLYDAQLATAIRKMKKNFYFVRTKVDSDLHSLKLSKPTTFNEHEILQRIRNDCVTQLQRANVNDAQVFLISSFELSSYDFQNLETTLLRELPAHKRHIFMKCLPNVTEAAIDRKRDSLKQKVWLEALKAGTSATIPLMGLISNNDVEKLEETLTLYRSYFGLDDTSLETMAKDLNVSVEKLKANLISPHLLSVEKDESLGKKLLRYVEKFCSISGGLIATGVYFRKIFYLQNYFLETVVSDAKRLLKKEEIFRDSEGSEQAYLL
ncbi:TGTP2 protein, partial [Crocuta crocuta]